MVPHELWVVVQYFWRPTSGPNTVKLIKGGLTGLKSGEKGPSKIKRSYDPDYQNGAPSVLDVATCPGC